MTGRHRRLRGEATIKRDLGAPPSVPRHRAETGEWKLIASTPRYTLHEHTETRETRTSWTTHEGFRMADL